MRLLLIISSLLFTFKSSANLSFIEFDKIPEAIQYQEDIGYLKKNIEFYQGWTPNWQFENTREHYIERLKKIYESLSSIKTKNQELHLLLGDIAHFIYNLDEQSFHEVAISNYLVAISNVPGDYRAKWFLAHHYALSSHQTESIQYYLEAQDQLPSSEPSEFWEGYIFATATANMPSHCRFAMDRFREITGKVSFFEEQLGKTISDRILPVYSDSTYHFKDIWTAQSGSKIEFTSRPLGMRVLIDSTWRFNLYNYNHYGRRQAFVTMVPSAEANESGREITYSIAIIARVAKEGELLQDFMNDLTNSYETRKPYEIKTGFEKVISYELFDSNMYKDIGGAHMHTIGIEREKPLYPGMLLEKPFDIPGSETSEVRYYRAGKLQDRFEGRIFYVIMLDTCEDIYKESLKHYMKVISDQLTIE